MTKPTRRIVMFNQVSTDGYFAAPDGSLEWTVQEPGVYESARASMPENGTMLFGRKTYENFEAFWPHALDESKTSPNPHAPGQRSEQMKMMAVWINETEKLVISKTRKSVTWKNSKLLHELDPKQIQALKTQPGKNIIIFGSGTIVTQLTEHQLIDDYVFVVSPLLLGKGQRLFGNLDSTLKLDLVESKSFDSGVVMLRYTAAK